MSSSCTNIKEEEEVKSKKIHDDPGTGCNDGALAGDETSVNRNQNDGLGIKLEMDLSGAKSNGSHEVSTLEIVSQNEMGTELPVLSKSALKRKMKKDLWEVKKKEKRFEIHK